MNTEPLPTGPFQVILADPPWNFETRSDKGRDKSPDYPVMNFSDICKMPISALSAKDSVLFIWTTGPFLMKTNEVITSWGFSYKTSGFTWVKTCKKSIDKPFMGGGYYTRSNAEFCLIATKGSGVKRVDASVRSAVFDPPNEDDTLLCKLGRHSAKPLRVKDDIVKLFGEDKAYLELFAREKSENWSGWGYDYPKLPATISSEVL
jgi:N6-adenosine-specific RNA methylase IME4